MASSHEPVLTAAHQNFVDDVIQYAKGQGLKSRRVDLRLQVHRKGFGHISFAHFNGAKVSASMKYLVTTSMRQLEQSVKSGWSLAGWLRRMEQTANDQ